MLIFKTCSILPSIALLEVLKKINKKWRESVPLFLVKVQPLLVVSRPLHGFTPFTNAAARVQWLFLLDFLLD